MFAVGDKVLMTGNDNVYVAEVVRITPKGFIAVRAFGQSYVRLFKSNGWERTSNQYDPRFISPLTDEDILLLEMKKKRKQALDAFQRVRNLLTKEQCETIIGWAKELQGV